MFCHLDILTGYFQVIASMGSQTQDGSLQVPAAIRNFSLSQKEKALDELVKDRWLCRSPEGNIGLGVRSYLDLRSWFHSSDIPSCEVCNEAVVKVVSPIFFHFYVPWQILFRFFIVLLINMDRVG